MRNRQENSERHQNMAETEADVGEREWGSSLRSPGWPDEINEKRHREVVNGKEWRDRAPWKWKGGGQMSGVMTGGTALRWSWWTLRQQTTRGQNPGTCHSFVIKEIKEKVTLTWIQTDTKGLQSCQEEIQEKVGSIEVWNKKAWSIEVWNIKVWSIEVWNMKVWSIEVWSMTVCSWNHPVAAEL